MAISLAAHLPGCLQVHVEDEDFDFEQEEHRSRQWMRRLLATLILLRYFDRWNSLPEGVMDLPEQDCKDASLRSVQARPCGTGARCDRQCGHYLCYPATHVLIGRVGGQTSEVLWHCRADQHCSSCHACHACLPACRRFKSSIEGGPESENCLPPGKNQQLPTFGSSLSMSACRSRTNAACIILMPQGTLVVSCCLHVECAWNSSNSRTSCLSCSLVEVR